MPEAGFDPLIHAQHRLQICAIADAASHVEFGELQDRLGLSKSALSKHIAQLVEHGYLGEERLTRAGHARLRVALTERGRDAYRGHIAALQAIIRAG